MIETRRSWWIAPAVLLCAFALLLWQVVAHGPLTRLDVHVRDGIQGTATSAGLHWLAQFGRGCADLGDQAPALLSLLIATGLAVWRTWSVQKSEQKSVQKSAPGEGGATGGRAPWAWRTWSVQKPVQKSAPGEATGDRAPSAWRTWSVQKPVQESVPGEGEATGGRAPSAWWTWAGRESAPGEATGGRVPWHSPLWRPVLLAAWAGLVLATVIPLKIWVARPGPGEVVLGNANLGFFPSGHTADALCCYGMACYLLCVFVWTGVAARRLLVTLTTLLLALTIFGLLWSNYHWLSDILGSLCWCGAWLLVIWHCSADRPPDQPTERPTGSSADRPTAQPRT